MVLAASSPDEALSMATSLGQSIDAIITDVVMPGMDGPALVKKLTESLGALPVLYLSGYMPDDLGLDLRLGDNYLRKPVEAERLLASVARLLEARQSRAGDGTSAA